MTFASAVLIDGCFWHGFPEHGQRVQAINGWYLPGKIGSNRERDSDIFRRLADAGRRVTWAWQHDDLEAQTEAAGRAIADTGGRG